SAAGMPQPSSDTRSSASPPLVSSTVMRRAPASSAFSISSLTTEAGRSTTSPAAILAAISGASWRIGMALPPPLGSHPPLACHCKAAHLKLAGEVGDQLAHHVGCVVQDQMACATHRLQPHLRQLARHPLPQDANRGHCVLLTPNQERWRP